MNARLQLLFHADHLKFCLIREFDDWRKEFNKLIEALNFAKKEGARELPFLLLHGGELYSESVVTVEPRSRQPGIADPEELAAFIKATLQKRDACRVFNDVLKRCWHLPSKPQRQKLIHDFAKEHGWEVKIFEPGAYGIVADFSLPAR